MLQEEVYRLAKAIDYLPIEQARDILGVVLERLKEDAAAIIADVWVRAPAEGGQSILEPFVSRADEGRPPRGKVVVTDQPESLLGCVVQLDKPLWLDELAVEARSFVNHLDGEPIVNHQVKVDHRTRSFAAVPIRYREQLRGVLSVEAAIPGRITRAHLDAMIGLEGPVGILLWKSSITQENYNHTQDAITSFRQLSNSLSSPLNPFKSGFIARPFSSEFELVERTLREVFEKKRIRVRPYQHQPGRGLVVTEMLAQIHAAHFGVADITGLNPNVLVELGALTSAGKPVIIFRRREETNHLPFDIGGYHFYESSISEGIVVIYNSADSHGRLRVEDLANSFIADVLTGDKSFREAKDWRAD